MRLALIGPSAPLRGGIAQYHDRLARALATSGHVVQRLSFRRLYPRLLFPGRTQYESVSPAPRTDAATGAGAAALSLLTPAEVLLDSIGPRSWAAVARRAASADAAIIEWWHPFFAPALATITALLRRRGVPTIFICHNLEPHEPVPAGASLAALALRRAAGFVVQSAADAARLRIA